MAEVVIKGEVLPRSDKSSLGVQSLAMTMGLLASRGLGFLRDLIIAYRFGASAATDAFLVAAQLPTVADSLLSGPALTNALMPIATAIDAGDAVGDLRFKRLIWNVSTLVFFVNAIAALGLAATANWIVPYFAAGFPQETRSLLVWLTAITMMGLPFMALTHVSWAILNARGRFWGPVLTLSLGNIAFILIALVCGPRFGVVVLGLGFVASMLIQAALQYAEMGHIRLLAGWRFNWRDPDVRAVWRLFAPLAIGQLMIVLGPTVDNAIASFLPTGAVTVIRYAFGITIPFSIISMAVAVPALPRLSRSVVTGNPEQVSELVRRVTSALSLILFGAAAWVFVVRYPLVSLLYGRGQFDDTAVRNTAATLSIYSFYIPFSGLYYFLLRGLVAFSASRAILKLSILGLVVNIVLDLVFLPFLAAAGIALSSVCVQLTFIVVTSWVLQRRLNNPTFINRLWRPIMAHGAAAVFAGAVASVITLLAGRIVSGGWLLSWLVPSVLVAAVYVGGCWLLRALNLDWFNSLLMASPLWRLGQRAQ